MNVNPTILYCLIGILGGLSLNVSGQKKLTQIEFHQFEPTPPTEEQGIVGLDTFSIIAQIVPVVKESNHASENNVVFQDSIENNLIRVEYRSSKSDFSKRVVDFERQTVDGDIAYGHDGFDAPKLHYIMQNHISALSIKINNKNIPIDSKLYHNFFSASIIRVLHSVRADLTILQISGGDGGGHYEAFLLFNRNGLVGCYINNGGDYFQPSPDYFSKRKFNYGIHIYHDVWSYFPNHHIAFFQPKGGVSVIDSVLLSIQSLNLSPLFKSDTVYGDFGRVLSPDRNEPLQFVVKEAIKSTTGDPLEYYISGIMKTGTDVYRFRGWQYIREATFANGFFVMSGTFIIESAQRSAYKRISGLWTSRIEGLSGLSSITLDFPGKINNENIHKTYEGVMTNFYLTNPALVRWGNITAMRNWYDVPPAIRQWWNGFDNRYNNYTSKEEMDWLHQFDFDGDGKIDEVHFDFSGGAHCCYSIAIVLSSDKKLVHYPFKMDGGYIGGFVDNSKPDQFTIDDIDGDGLAEIIMEIETYNGETSKIPLDWRARYGIKTNKIIIEYQKGRLQVRDFDN